MKRCIAVLAALLLFCVTGCEAILPVPPVTPVVVDATPAPSASASPTPYATLTPEPSVTGASTPIPPTPTPATPTPPAVPFTLPLTDRSGPVYTAQIGNLWVYYDGWDGETVPSLYAITLDAPETEQPRRIWHGAFEPFLVCGERIMFFAYPPGTSLPLRGILLDPADGSYTYVEKRQSEFYMPIYGKPDEVWFRNYTYDNDGVREILSALDIRTMKTRNILDPAALDFIDNYPIIVAVVDDAPVYISGQQYTMLSADGTQRKLPGTVSYDAMELNTALTYRSLVGEESVTVHYGADDNARIVVRDTPAFFAFAPGCALADDQYTEALAAAPGEAIEAWLVTETMVYPLKEGFSRRPASYNGRVVPFPGLMESDGIPVTEFPILK